MDSIEEIKQGGLYSLLSACSNQELEPLVYIITATLTNNLKTYELYKKRKPNYKQSYKEIGDKIRLIGSDPLASIFRGGKGVDYKEIVIDACKLLDIPYKNNDIVGNEKSLISLCELEKKTITSSIPASIVTVNCVLYIATLRQKKIQKYKSQLIKKEDPYTKQNIEKKLEIKNEENELILSFAQLSGSSSLSQKIQPIKVEKNEISHLNSLVQTIPNLITAHNVNTTKYMEVSINGMLAKAKSGGYRGFSRGENGQITEHARLFDSKKLSNLAGFSALYNIASVVVSQQHLADINAKLNEINNTLETIKSFQNNERESKIKGAILYFEQVASSVVNGNLIDSILYQIEANERELLGVQTHIQKDIGHLNSNINLNDNDIFGTEDLAKSIEKYQDDIYSLYSQFLLCIRARACGWQLLTFYPVSDDLLNNRYNDLRQSVSSLSNAHFLGNTNKSIKDNIKILSSIFNTEYTLNKRKLFLLNKNEYNLENIKISIGKVEEELAFAESLHRGKKDNNAKLLLKIKDGNVVEVSSTFY